MNYKSLTPTPIEIATDYIRNWSKLAFDQFGFDIETAKIIEVDWHSSNSDNWTFVVEHDGVLYTLYSDHGERFICDNRT